MSQSSMLVSLERLLEKIEARRGEMSSKEFLESLIDGDGTRPLPSFPQEEGTSYPGQEAVTREEMEEFERGIRDLLRSFIDFFLAYGLPLEGTAAKRGRRP